MFQSVHKANRPRDARPLAATGLGGGHDFKDYGENSCDEERENKEKADTKETAEKEKDAADQIEKHKRDLVVQTLSRMKGDKRRFSLLKIHDDEWPEKAQKAAADNDTDQGREVAQHRKIFIIGAGNETRLLREIGWWLWYHAHRRQCMLTNEYHATKTHIFLRVVMCQDGRFGVPMSKIIPCTQCIPWFEFFLPQSARITLNKDKQAAER